MAGTPRGSVTVGPDATAGNEILLYNLHMRSVLADGFMFFLRMPFLATGSMTLVSETIRSFFTFGASISAFCVLRLQRRGRFKHFDFGIGRIDQAVKLVAGLGLVLSAAWIAGGIAGRLSEPAAASPLGLALAAIVNAVNLTKNGILLSAMLHGERNGANVIHGAQLRARAAMVLSNVALQVTLTLAALARDAHLAMLLDAAGAAFVAGAMFYYGVPMIARSLPLLVDAPAPPLVAQAIRRAFATALPDGAIARIRTRRTSGGAAAQIALSRLPPAPLAEVERRVDAELRGLGASFEICVVLSPAGPKD